MAHHVGFFTYLRLKVIVTLLRGLLVVQGYLPLRRDRLLAQKIPVHRERVRIPSRDPARFIDAYLYHPPSPSSGPAPVVVNWHGSGWVFPLLGSDELYCRRIAHEASIYVLDADYRKAPENPYPGPLNDVEDALRWVGLQSSRFDPARVALSGFSAGAHLALVAASALRKSLAQLHLTIVAVVAHYPETDLSAEPETKTVPAPIRPHPHAMLHFFHDCFVPDKDLRTDPKVSPSRADPAEFPPHVIMLTASGDVFSPEAVELAAKLDDGRRTVVVKTLADVHHGFDKGAQRGTKEWDRREEAYEVVVKSLKDALQVS
ncbi:alpha/beta-hydrolase [Canariomyces notabilis]|uniref:Alpha/beta-hydrolase n=1 Tax=Canariomyces notabilis TaxID=2074819 RepID=A0AAN6QHE5_9PEZI|nr:alpha/beta-hydrolase [Canariomyces arenarius]